MSGGWDAVWDTGSTSGTVDPLTDVTARDDKTPVSARLSVQGPTPTKTQDPTPTSANDVLVLQAMLEELRQDLQRHHEDVKRSLTLMTIALCVAFALVYRSVRRIEQRR